MITEKQLKTRKTIQLSDIYVLAGNCTREKYNLVQQFVAYNQSKVVEFRYYPEYQNAEALMIDYRISANSFESQDVSRVLDTMVYFEKLLEIGYFVDVYDNKGNFSRTIQVRVNNSLSRKLHLVTPIYKTK